MCMCLESARKVMSKARLSGSCHFNPRPLNGLRIRKCWCEVQVAVDPVISGRCFQPCFLGLRSEMEKILEYHKP